MEVVVEVGLGNVLASRARVTAVRGALESRSEGREVERVVTAGGTWYSEVAGATWLSKVAGGWAAAAVVAASRRARNSARRAALRRRSDGGRRRVRRAASPRPSGAPGG